LPANKAIQPYLNPLPTSPKQTLLNITTKPLKNLEKVNGRTNGRSNGRSKHGKNERIGRGIMPKSKRKNSVFEGLGGG
jgi:hypothetical protein